MKASAQAHEQDDRQVVNRVLAGDRGAFELLVRRHNQRLYRAARAITHADADAEDALQSAWLSVFRHLSQFRGDASFATWATRIAVNEAVQQTRKRPIVAEIVDSTSDEEHADDRAERMELGVLLERCLAGIPQGNREVMVLRDVLELDTAETAACLALTEEAVRVRLHRARAAVAAVLSEKLSDHAREVYGFDGARCDRITAAVMQIVFGA
ncbi:MAG: sigma-70 family RNA polymerase sigma factor [Kofleriaceae bacterium]